MRQQHPSGTSLRGGSRGPVSGVQRHPSLVAPMGGLAEHLPYRSVCHGFPFPEPGPRLLCLSWSWPTSLQGIYFFLMFIRLGFYLCHRESCLLHVLSSTILPVTSHIMGIVTARPRERVYILQCSVAWVKLILSQVLKMFRIVFSISPTVDSEALGTPAWRPWMSSYLLILQITVDSQRAEGTCSVRQAVETTSQ